MQKLFKAIAKYYNRFKIIDQRIMEWNVWKNKNKVFKNQKNNYRLSWRIFRKIY